MKIKAKLTSLAVVAVVIGSQTTVASNADQPTLAAGDYIVVFDNQANEQAEAAKLRGQGANIKFTYSSVFKGLAGTFNAAQISALQKNPRVSLIEADGVVSIDGGSQSPTPSWGLDRIDQTSSVLDQNFSYTNTGAGVTAYVIDTGIASKNSDFTGRLKAGYTAVGGGTEDCNGHGTHVAGTIGGTYMGIAKSVTLVPVRVLGCNGSGSISGVISGVDWVKNNASKPAVANMSLGGGNSTSLDAAVANLILSGVTVSVAAGNSTTDACNTSPARVDAALTVGASDNTDSIAYFSNFGKCLDLFAPGVGIISDGLKSGTKVSMSGTSMASPHVAGVVALYLQTYQAASPSTVSAALKALAALNASVKGTNAVTTTRLLYKGNTL